MHTQTRRMRRTRRTWKVWKNAIPICQSDIQRQRKYLKSHAEVVFNPNSKRRQATIPETDSLLAKLQSRLGPMLGNHTLQTPVVLQSLTGCKQQQWHMDYDDKNTTGFGMLLALQNGTRLETRECTIHLKQGDLLIFNGDLVHAGSWYDCENLRIHAYLDVVGGHRRANSTYLIV